MSLNLTPPKLSVRATGLEITKKVTEDLKREAAIAHVVQRPNILQVCVFSSQLFLSRFCGRH
jgi:hypothetical protein